MSIENFMGKFKNNSEKNNSEKLEKGKDVINNLFDSDEVNKRLERANQQI